MKKFILHSIVFVFFIGLNAQTIEKLDIKNGFKDFILGESYSKWESFLVRTGSWDDGSVGYSYNGNCCLKIFEYDVESILLRFHDNKIVGIYITTKKFQESYVKSGKYTEWRTQDFESIRVSFTMLFGEPSYYSTSDSGNVTFQWKGKKVNLNSTYEFLGTEKGDRVQVSLEDLTFINEGVKNGF
jgi:hypothetical protein